MPLSRFRHTPSKPASLCAATLFAFVLACGSEATTNTPEPTNKAEDGPPPACPAGTSRVAQGASTAWKLPRLFLTNASFGGSDRRTLYITATTSIYQVVLKNPGLP
jgi:hypothetical protein